MSESKSLEECKRQQAYDSGCAPGGTALVDCGCLLCAKPLSELLAQFERTHWPSDSAWEMARRLRKLAEWETKQRELWKREKAARPAVVWAATADAHLVSCEAVREILEGRDG